MTELDDELSRLRAADPVDPAALPLTDGPAAAALLERITSLDAGSPGRRWLPVAAAAAAVAVVGAVGFLIERDTGADPAPIAGPEVTTTTLAGISPGSAFCVEQYDLTTLGHRELAFDGTISAVDGDVITFAVNHWYRGGDSTELTLGGAVVLGGLTSAGDALPLDPGTRLLVAGDGGFAWGCGFTQPHDPAVAAQWDAVFASR